MSSYSKPKRYDNKSHFNSTEFEEFDNETIESSLKSLESSAKNRPQVEVGANADGTHSGFQSFSVAFERAPRVVCQMLSNSNTITQTINIYSVSTSGFYYRKFQIDSSTNSASTSSSSNFHWMAIHQ